MAINTKLGLVALFLSIMFSGGCLQNFFQDSSDNKGAAACRDTSDKSKTGNSSTPAQQTGSSAFLGAKPDQATPPGPNGPFVEPPLKGRPEFVYMVVVAFAENPWELEDELKKVEAFRQVPIGYPAVDQDPDNKGFVLLAGKFARAPWARALAESLRSSHQVDARVVQKPYEFDRLKPASNFRAGIKAGRILAGVTGVPVPVLVSAGNQALGTGLDLEDGALVAVSGEKWVGNRLWLEIRYKGGKSGFVPSARVLVDANLFPSPGGSAAILGVGLGCNQDGRCRWDYWLVDKGFAERRLLKSAGERMPHAFSPDGKWLAYTTFDPSILVTSTTETVTLELGPGISPSFSPDGTLLYFRGPGVRGQRDDVRTSVVASWKSSNTKPPVKRVLDFKGTPIYPRAISTVPPRVDFLKKGKLFTLFFRLGKKVAKKSVHRWGVIFTPDGKILEKAGVAISD